MKFSDILNSKH